MTTIDTLTAEVHILKIGGRSVTTAIYKQLDFVDFDHIEPFGRVRHLYHHGGNVIEVIGRHKRTGALVCSTVRPERQKAYEAAKELPLITLAGGLK
jgi:hypothetical protein